MTKCKLIIVTLLTATPALAEPPYLIKPTYNYGAPEPYRRTPELSERTIQGLREMELLPPAEFDRGYDGILTIIRGPQAVVRAACPQIKPERPALGCSVRYLGGNTCTVYIVNDITLQANGWTYDLVLRHEIGHCNSWRHSEKFR